MAIIKSRLTLQEPYPNGNISLSYQNSSYQHHPVNNTGTRARFGEKQYMVIVHPFKIANI